MASQHCLSYSPASAPGSAGSVDCSKVIGCLTPGSVPTSALAPGPLPTGVTIADSQITYANPAAVGSTGLLSIGGQTIQLIHPISSLGTIRTDYWAFQ